MMAKELERRRDAFDDLGDSLESHSNDHLCAEEEGEDLTPTWAGLMPALMEILENGAPKGKVGVRSELMRLAEFADRVNNRPFDHIPLPTKGEK